jgi:hypothetical protein
METIKTGGHIKRMGRIDISPLAFSGLEIQMAKIRSKGKDINESHILGARGELIFASFMYQQNIPHMINHKWLDDQPVPQYDFIMGTDRVDVKTLTLDYYDLLIKSDEHHNQNKVIDKYFFIQIIDNRTANYWIFEFDEVSQWLTKKGKYGINYFKPLNTIK